MTLRDLSSITSLKTFAQRILEEILNKMAMGTVWVPVQITGLFPSLCASGAGRRCQIELTLCAPTSTRSFIFGPSAASNIRHLV